MSVFARPVRVFVYENHSSAVLLAPCTNVRLDKDLFEVKMHALLRHSDELLQASEPAQADVLYHPACLVDYYFRFRDSADSADSVQCTAYSVQLQRLFCTLSTLLSVRPSSCRLPKL